MSYARTARLSTVAPISAIALVLGLSAACGVSGPSSGGKAEITIAAQAPLTSLDMARTNSESSVLSLVTEPLERAKSDGTVTPVLATSVAVSPGKLVYKIRPKVMFTDGKPLTTADVVYSMKRLADPKAAPQTASLLTAIKSIVASGPNEVTVMTNRVDPGLRNNLAFAIHVVEKSGIEAHPKDFGSASAPPIGTGPYKVVKFSTDQIVLASNDKYWGSKPAFKTITSKYIPDDNTARLAMRSGDLDVKFLRDVGSAGQWKSIPRTSLAVLPTTSLDYLSFDVTKAPFDDIHVRKAIAYAVDRPALSKVIYGGYARVLQGMLTPEELGVVSSPADAKTFLASLPEFDFDLVKAKAELAQSQHPNGFSVTVPVTANIAFGEKTMLSLQEKLKPLGIHINLKTLPFDQWVATLLSHKNLGMQTMSYGPITPDPAAVLTLVAAKEQAVPNGNNTANFYPAAVQQSLSSLGTSTDKSARSAAAKLILTAIAEQVPYIPLYNKQTIIVTGNGLTYEMAGADYGDYVTGAWVDHVRG